jgi:ribonuclease HI
MLKSKDTKESTITIYTDGACSKNPGEGGIGIYLKWKDTIKTISGYLKHTTNNQMELIAVIEALKAIKKENQTIIVYTDSKYVKDGLTLWLKNWKKNNWKNSQKEPVKNKNLWELLDYYTNLHTVKFEWVKGHSTDEINNLVDKIARESIQNKAPVLDYNTTTN